MTLAGIDVGVAIAPKTSTCDFCEELRQSPSSTFARSYAGLASDRVIFETSNLAVIPTMGQVLPGSLLVLPKLHIETMAELASSALTELEHVIAKAERLMGADNVVIYEHGAKAWTGGSCGIYHAHAHLSPLVRPIAAERIFADRFERVAHYTDALAALAGASQYLIYSAGLSTAYQDLSNGSAYDSQYLRRRLAELSGAQGNWDWRSTAQPERALLTTLRAMRDAVAEV